MQFHHNASTPKHFSQNQNLLIIKKIVASISFVFNSVAFSSRQCIPYSGWRIHTHTHTHTHNINRKQRHQQRNQQSELSLTGAEQQQQQHQRMTHQQRNQHLQRLHHNYWIKFSFQIKPITDTSCTAWTSIPHDKKKGKKTPRSNQQHRTITHSFPK